LLKTYTRCVGIEQAPENVKEQTIIVAGIMNGWRFEDFRFDREPSLPLALPMRKPCRPHGEHVDS
jgi:hypothetical protein